MEENVSLLASVVASFLRASSLKLSKKLITFSFVITQKHNVHSIYEHQTEYTNVDVFTVILQSVIND